MPDEQKEDTTRHPIAVVESGLPVPLSERMAGKRLDYWASWPIDTPADRAAVYNAKNSECAKLIDNVGQQVKVSGVIAHLVQLTEPTSGEVHECVRCVLFRPEAVPLECVSSGVQESVRDLVSQFGEGPWSPPLVLIPRRVKTRQGFYCMKLELDTAAMLTQDSPNKDKPANVKPKKA